MSVQDRKIKSGIIIAVVVSSALIIISIITFAQLLPVLSQTKGIGVRAYDQEYIASLRHIGDAIPQNESLAASDIHPQAPYFIGHEVRVPWVRSEKALVQFMWKNNCSYLLVPEYTSEPKPDNTPLLIQLAKKPFEKISDFYARYIAEPKPDNNAPLLNLHRSIKEDAFNRLFEKISDYNTQTTILHLYKLRSSVTGENLNILADKARPILDVSLPINNTVLQSKFGALRVNVTGTAMDVDSNINQVEVSIESLPFELANPRAPDDWSTWSFSDIVAEGTKTIVVRATDNAGNSVWAPVYITVK